MWEREKILKAKLGRGAYRNLEKGVRVEILKFRSLEMEFLAF